MDHKKIFVLFIILSQNAISRQIAPKPINFEFSHHEVLAISDSDDDVEEQDYYDDPLSNSYMEGHESSHFRKLNSIKWAPNYDLYEQWTEEYYDQSEESEEKIENILHPKESLLDRLISATQNKTEEEIELERKEEQQQREILKSTILYGSWVIGIMVVLCFVVFLMKKCWRIFACDFCDAFNYKDKIKNFMANTVPGTYVHKNGKKEYYKPTEEELEAIKDLQKILFSLA